MQPRWRVGIRLVRNSVPNPAFEPMSIGKPRFTTQLQRYKTHGVKHMEGREFRI